MQHRGLEYTVVQGIERGVWKWSASVAGVVLVGKAETRSEAVAAAKKAVDRALAQRTRPDEASEPLLQPLSELPDDTLICDVDLPTRIRTPSQAPDYGQWAKFVRRQIISFSASTILEMALLPIFVKRSARRRVME